MIPAPHRLRLLRGSTEREISAHGIELAARGEESQPGGDPESPRWRVFAPAGTDVQVGDLVWIEGDWRQVPDRVADWTMGPWDAPFAGVTFEAIGVRALTAAQMDSIRAWRVRTMTATCIIRTRTTKKQVAGRTVDVLGEVLFEGPILVDPAERSAGETDSGQQELTTAAYNCAIPWHVEGITTGCTVELTAGVHPDLIAREPLHVTELIDGVFETERRFRAIDDQG